MTVVFSLFFHMYFFPIGDWIPLNMPLICEEDDLHYICMCAIVVKWTVKGPRNAWVCANYSRGAIHEKKLQCDKSCTKLRSLATITYRLIVASVMNFVLTDTKYDTASSDGEMWYDATTML